MKKRVLFFDKISSMSKFACGKCGYISVSWYGRCPQCQQYNSFSKIETEAKSKNKNIKAASYKPLNMSSALSKNRIKTGFDEFDHVLGNGFAEGEAVFLAGQPGIGKSTLLLSALADLKVLYVSGEESDSQVKLRADRLGIELKNFFYSSETSIESIVELLRKEKNKFDMVVIDSVQTCYSSDIPAPSGTISQIRQAVATFVDLAKELNIVCVMIGHITKGGEIAGPKTLEHLVDCVLYLEGARDSQFRILRSLKNRFGSTDEIGLFEMTNKGLVSADYSSAFISDEESDSKIVGRSVVGVREGSRVVFYEIQSLVVPTFLAVPRRVVSGVDFNKVQLMLAVLRKYLKLQIDKFDVFINVAGGVSIKSTAADLGIAASVYSSLKNIPIAKNIVFSGEVGLLGEVRKVWGEEKIIKEAKKYKFSKIYTSEKISSLWHLPQLLK